MTHNKSDKKKIWWLAEFDSDNTTYIYKHEVTNDPTETT